MPTTRVKSVDITESQGLPPRGCSVWATHTRTAATLTCTRGSTASSTRSESSALSFCTRPLIIKSRGWILFTALPCHLCVSSARHQVAMLDVKKRIAAASRAVSTLRARTGKKACAFFLAGEFWRTWKYHLKLRDSRPDMQICIGSKIRIIELIIV